MWQSVTIPLASGANAVGVNILTKANLPFNNEGAPLILHKIYIPAQPGLTSGACTVTISEVTPDTLLTAMYTLTNPTIPFNKPVESLFSDGTGTATANYVLQAVNQVNVKVASGNGANIVTVWLLFI